MKDVVIAGALRTAIGDFGGALKAVSPSELAQHVMKEVMNRANVQPEWINKIIFGNCFAPLEQNIARNAAYKIGIPQEAPAFTINSTCGSSLQAIISATQAIQCGEAEVILAGGVESMSTAPYLMESARWGQRLRHAELYDLVWRGMQEYPIGVGMGLTAENLAQKYQIPREEQDAFALLSHQRAAKAIDEQKFVPEITPITIPVRKGNPIIFSSDEHVRRDTSLEQLAKLPPAFKKDGTVTAGNACGMSDACAAVVVAAEERAEQIGLRPLARILGYATVGVDPDYMGIGPVPATKEVLRKVGLSLKDIQLIEINEAFAAQYLACERELGLNREIANVNGSGISLGHPVGATGCRLIVTLIHEMTRRNLNLGLATLCAGGGQGFAMVIERE